MEPEQIGEAIGNAIGNLVAKLLGFRTMLTVLDTFCALIGGWIYPLAYRDAGERGLRAALGGFLEGAGLVALLFVLQFTLGGVGVLTVVILIWAAALRYADWLSAMDRRKREQTAGYTYSYFIGWTRFFPPERRYSREWQGALTLVAGALLFIVDHAGGVLVIIAGFSLLARLWVIRARRREDVMDALDAEWLSTDRSGAKMDAGGADVRQQDETIAQIASTADLVRYYSTR